jgi:hypothetical protein
MEKMGLKMIGTWVIRTKRGIQWDRSQERCPRGGWVLQKKKGLKLKGTTVIRMKRGMQWDRSQIRVLTGPIFFFTPAELYSELNNTAEAECPNS